MKKFLIILIFALAFGLAVLFILNHFGLLENMFWNRKEDSDKTATST